MPPAGTITFTNVTLRILIRDAYNLEMDLFTLISGPFARIVGNAPGTRPEDALRFDVQAKPPENSQPQERREMLRVLLEDRFRLRAHKEMRPLPVMRSQSPGPAALGRI